jgi:WD40 repeat protein
LKGVLKGHSSYIQNLDWSRDGNSLQSVCGAYELLFWKVDDLKQITDGATLLRDEKWATYTVKIGWPVQGIFPPATNGTHVNGVDRTKD